MIVNFSLFLSNFQFRAEVKKVTSRVELSQKSFSSSYGLSQLCSDSSLVFAQTMLCLKCCMLYKQVRSVVGQAGDSLHYGCFLIILPKKFETFFSEIGFNYCIKLFT